MRHSDIEIKQVVARAIEEHIRRDMPFTECMFRPGSASFNEFYRQVRERADELNLDWEDQELIETDIGHNVRINGEIVPLGVPMIEEEELDEASCGEKGVKPNSPKRGGSKKFYVYVRNPKTGNVKKVNFGDKNMRIKKSNPKRRKSFRARHNCDNPGPKTKARYWSCRKW